MSFIDLTNINHIFVDFDDTLVIHQHNIHIYEKNKFLKEAFSEVNVYPHSTPNKAIISLLMQAKKEGIKSHVLSWVNNSIETKVKEKYCQQHSPGLIHNVLGVASHEDKTGLMLAFAESNKIKPENIMFIDDRIDTLKSAKNAGFTVYTPQWIMEKHIEYFLYNKDIK